MPSVLASNALTTLATVLDELGLVSDSGGAQDMRFERYINAASAFCARFCDRTFERATGIVERAKGFGGTHLIVSRTPIVTVTSIALDGDAFDTDTYAVHDAEAGILYRAAGWPNTAPRLPGITQPYAPGMEERSIVVTYDGGYVTPAQVGTRTLPWDLEDVVVQMVTSRWRGRGNDIRIRQETHEAKSYTFGGVPIPPEQLAVLAHYARIPVA